MQYKIEYMPIEKLQVNPENPRFIKDNAFKNLVKSLKDCPKLFDARPCLCSDRTGELKILAGNMRYLAAKELKYKEVPVIVMSGLSEIQEREILLKDNGTTWGEWDMDLLSGWDDLPLIDWGVGELEGLSGDEETEKLKQKEKEIKPYKKVHVLISLDLESADEATDLLDQLRKMPGVEIEQSAN